MAGEYEAEEVGQVSVFQRLVPDHQAAVQHDTLFNEWRHLEHPADINKQFTNFAIGRMHVPPDGCNCSTSSFSLQR